jgi:hypothetical protein
MQLGQRIVFSSVRAEPGLIEAFPSGVVAGLVPATPIAMALRLHTLL